MEEEEKIKIAKEIYEKSNDKKSKKKIEEIVYYEEFEFLKANEEFYNFSEQNIFVVEKKENKGKKKISTYEIYNKKGEKIAGSNEKGNIEFTQEYKEKLDKIPKELYNKIGFDKREMKIEDIEKNKNVEKVIENTNDKENVVEKKETKNTNNDMKKETKKDSKKDKEIPKSKKEKIQKMSNDLDVDINDIKSSSEIKDKEFYRLVPEAIRDFKGWVSIVYIGSTNEFKIIGQDMKTGKFKPLKTVLPSQAVEQKTTIDIESRGENVERKSIGNLGGVLKIKGNTEYSFSANIKEIGPIEFKELRREKNTGEYLATEMKTTYQWPINREAEKIMEKRKNEDIIDEVKKYKKEELKGNKVVNQEKIKDENIKTEKEKEREQEEKKKQLDEEKQKVPWEHLKKYGY